MEGAKTASPASGVRGLLGTAASSVAGFISRSTAAKVVIIALAALLLLFAADYAVNGDKIYANVSVGEVDVSGMTVEEAASAIEEVYADRVTGASITICADEDTLEAVRSGEDIENLQESEEISVDEATENRTTWTTNASRLEASLEADALAEEAFALGRSDGGIAARLYAALFGREIEAAVQINESALEKLASSIDATLGEPRKNWDIEIEDGIATTAEGHDGYEIDRDWLESKLIKQFLDDDSNDAFLAKIEYAPLQVDKAQAKAVAREVNDAIEDGAVFTFEGDRWKATAEQLGNWLKTEVVDEGDSYTLSVMVDADKLKPALLKHFSPNFDSDDARIEFEAGDDGSVLVHTSASGTMPVAESAVTKLENALFGEDADHTTSLKIKVKSTEIPESMSVQAALDYGIITTVSSYTTEYTEDAEARNTNIHLAADLLDNSIIKADGGEWSFNDTTGECNEEKGFQAAGTILDGEHVDSVGGGICQVATTVFNCVYEGGYEILTRHNHTLYIASYPDGRDAAVSYPELDLVWANDSSNDLLMRTSYTDTSITVALIGVDPERTVATETGEWEEGEEYEEVTEKSDEYPKGYTYIKQSGVDGSQITVVRTVTDSNGDVLHTDAFTSVYDAEDEITVKGTG